MLQSLDEVLIALEAMTPEEKAETIKLAMKATAHLPWVCNPGPQRAALDSEADELLFGGSAGGGKSSFLVGLAITAHHKSIIFRREYPQIKGLEDEATRILGSRQGYNGADKVWRIPGTDKVLEFGSCPHEHDKEKYQGRPHDLIGFDEVPHMTESQYRFLIGWNRSASPGQRCRVVATANPPVSPEQAWICYYWGAWLDPEHPNPAEPGELRWYTTIDGKDVELLTGDPIEVKGRMVTPRSRTFIPARLEDNPDLMRTGYASVLEAMPEELRKRLRDGIFTPDFQDDEFQVIPTAWIEAAQARWTPDPPEDKAMTAIGVDIAQGGNDKTVLAPRYDSWFAPLIVAPGVQTPDGPSAAALVVIHQRDGAQVNIDMGGGWGGSCYDHLKSNDLASVLAVVPSMKSTGKTADGKLSFVNIRAEYHWRLREALDPQSGLNVALPKSPTLKADLAAPRWRLTPSGIRIEEKDGIKERLGRSPDEGEAVMLSWFSGGARVRSRNHRYNSLPTMATNPNRDPRAARRHQRAQSYSSGGGEQG